MSILERALAQLEGGTLEVDAARRHCAAASAAGAPVRLDDPRPRVSSGGSRRAASSGSASPTRQASGRPTTSSALFELLLRNAGAASERHARVRRLLELRPRLNRRNGLLRARRNIAYHYDLGNDLFELMLDETMTYSCAVFESAEQSLADAQRAKYERLCDKLELGPGRPRARDRLRLGRLRALRGDDVAAAASPG